MSAAAATKNIMMGVSQPISVAHPDANELESTKTLKETLKEFKSYEPIEETKQRIEVLRELNTLVKEWVLKVTLKKMPNQGGINLGGQLIPFGSYRLGVHSSGSDIDCLCIVPRHVTSDDFFSTFKSTLLHHPKVKDLQAVREASVPLLTMKFNGIEVDLLFARLDLPAIPDRLDLSDDTLLKNIDERSVRSLNGCRVAEQILKLVPDPVVFSEALRAVKLWAKARGVYSNALGYFGGITWAILVARTCQLYPNATSSKIVHRMFFVFSTWNWPNAVTLNQLDFGRTDLPELRNLVWNPRDKYADRNHLMPVLTPSFPQQNSTHNVNRSSAVILKAEMASGLETCRRISEGNAEWSELFKEVNFFTHYKHFLVVAMAAADEQHALDYSGFLESRIRRLVQLLESNAAVKLVRINTRRYQPIGSAKLALKSENTLRTIWIVGLEFANAAKLDLSREIAKFQKTIEQPESSVDTDILYVKRSELYTVVPSADLRRGLAGSASNTTANRKRASPCDKENQGVPMNKKTCTENH